MALPLVSITGKVYFPDGTPATGSLVVELTQPGSALDGAASQRVGSRATEVVAADGSAGFSLVPNDQISPAGTVYQVTYFLKNAAGQTAPPWSEFWTVPSTPSPVGIGAITPSDALFTAKAQAVRTRLGITAW